ncbi:MAG: hypothetical protein ACI9BD_000476 [Candidatus Marinamargulisbacteria bacterium]|jgi:hypothetical protein
MRSALVIQYVLSPFETLNSKRHIYPVSLFLLCICLIAFCRLPLVSFQLNSYPFAFLFLVTAYTVFLAGISVCFDFFAQIFQLKAQSLKLFFWLGMTLSPLLLTPPLHILQMTFPPIFYVITLAEALCFLSVLYLQIRTIQALYETTLKQSIVIYCLPLIAFTAIFGTFLFLTGALGLLNLDF